MYQWRTPAPRSPRWMRRPPLVTFTAILALSLGVLTRGASAQEMKPALTLQDMLEWKSIRNANLSDDGKWFAYGLAPNEGDGEVVIRSTADATEYRFPIGEARFPSIAFSDDARFVAFTIAPTRAANKAARQSNKPARNKAGLVDLSSGELTEFKDVQSFVFDGERSKWLALRKYRPAGGGGGPDRGSGSDLVLHELDGGARLNIGNVSSFFFNEEGSFLIWIVDADGMTGNGIQMRRMETGTVHPLESGEAKYSNLSMTDEDDGFTVLKGMKHDDYEEMLYSVVGFRDLARDSPSRTEYDPQDDPSFPEGMRISPNRTPRWTEDQDAILFGIDEAKMKEAGKEKEDDAEGGDDAEEEEKKPAETKTKVEKDEMPDFVLWHWQDPRLQSQQQVQEGSDKRRTHLSSYRVREGRFVRLADETLRSVSPVAGERWGIGTDNREYELMSHLDGKSFKDVHIVDMHTGERRLALETNRWSNSSSPDGKHYLYYQDKHFHVLDLATGESRNITKAVKASFVDRENDRPQKDPPTRVFGWVRGGESVLISDNWDIWKVEVDGSGGTNLTVNGKKDQIRYRGFFSFDEDAFEEGIDLSKDQYVAPYGEWTKQRGFGVLRAGTTGIEVFYMDDATLGQPRKAEDADVYVITRSTPADYPDYHLADAMFKPGERLTDANPQQKDFAWTPGSQLVNYKCDKGERAQAALFLPAGYEAGKQYPMVVYFYEKTSQGKNGYTSPSTRAFNTSHYTSNGYAVLNPDIYYRVNDPGRSALWCMVPAVKAAIETGMIDQSRVGITGHSWGGYQTSFLVTQTDIFAAAIAGAPLTNMISMYASIYWNAGIGDGEIFESSQGRFWSHYLGLEDEYIRNSPVFFADRVNTPLIILHNDKDGAVDFNQGIEYYNILRRLQKPVAMFQYVGENHGVSKPANAKDYLIRMKEFFDHYLMDAPAPDWWTNGVPHLKMKEHLEDRVRAMKDAAKKEDAKKAAAVAGGKGSG